MEFERREMAQSKERGRDARGEAVVVERERAEIGCLMFLRFTVLSESAL